MITTRHLHWFVSRLLPRRTVTVTQLTQGVSAFSRWRPTDITAPDGIVKAQTPGPSRPGFVGAFPIEVEDEL